MGEITSHSPSAPSLIRYGTGYQISFPTGLYKFESCCQLKKKNTIFSVNFLELFDEWIILIEFFSEIFSDNILIDIDIC